MQLPTFIRLENSKEKALAYYNSPQMTEYSFAGVHLLPFNIWPYLQNTYSDDGIELEATGYVFVCDLCGNRLFDINECFTFENYNDPSTGLPQITWKLLNVPFDAGNQLVYLEIENGGNAPIFSSPFILSQRNSDFTSRWDYQADENTVLAIGLQIYFRHKKSNQEVTNYHPVNNGRLFTTSTILTKYERWNTSVVDINIIEAFKELFLSREVYSKPENFDGMPVRTGLLEAVDTPDLEMDENFAEQEILLLRNYADTFDPIAPIIIPPAPEPNPPYIFITLMEALAIDRIRYNFNYGDFPTAPEIFYFGWSLDNVTWTESQGVVDTNSENATTTIRTSALNTRDNDYYFRIKHLPTNTTSNIARIPRTIIITNVIQDGSNFSIYFTANFNLLPGTSFIFQATTNLTPWYTVSVISSGNGYVVVGAFSNSNRFRILYNEFGITSNTYIL